MIAFTIFGRPIYRYGIAYAVTFLGGYVRLQWITKQGYLSQFPKVESYFQTSLDDFVTLIILGILLGGRLGHVVLYEWNYYSQHLSEILMVQQGGMAFLGGVIAVVITLLYIQWKQRFSFSELKVIGDLVLCIVPLGIFLGRIANFLNQELVGKAITALPLWFQKIAELLGLVHIYSLVDMIPRFNVNLVQSFFEGLVTLVVGQILFHKIYRNKGDSSLAQNDQGTNASSVILTKEGSQRIKRDSSFPSEGPRIQPGTIVSFFFIRYGMVRFLLEYTKDIGSYEYWGWLTVSQWLCVGLVISGLCILKLRPKPNRILMIIICFCFSVSFSFSKDSRSIDDLIGNIEVSHNKEFAPIPLEYSAITGKQLYLRKDATDAFLLMNEAFTKDIGYSLKLNSAFRSYDEQKQLRDTNPNLQLKIVGLPGTSQHHCCAIDIDKEKETRETIVFPWLQQHAKKYGFIMPFTTTGSDYNFEKEDWHYVYQPLLDDWKEAYFDTMSDQLLDDINGNAVATEFAILKSYVFGNDFTKILQKRALRKVLEKKKKRLQYLIFKNRQKDLHAQGYDLMANEQGVSYYRILVEPGTMVQDTIKILQLSGDHQIQYYMKLSTGKLLRLSPHQKLSKKSMIFVIFGP